MNTDLSTGQQGQSRKRSLKPLWTGLLVLALLSPLGLLAQGTAWGEWGGQELHTQLQEAGLSQVPEGMERLGNLWNAPLSGYDLPLLGNATLGYIVSAFAGIVMIVAVTYLLGKLVAKNDEAGSDV